MSQTGLFGWIRDGVRQSVLMGVSDAMEVLGTPNDPEQLHPALQSMASSTMQRIAASEPSGDAGATRPVGERAPQRKRLGRSLKDLSPGGPASNSKSGS
ncbi:MAG: hypothetical protein ACK553_18120 [Planctomycetota bacterium]|jgi:hypothetical protein